MSPRNNVTNVTNITHVTIVAPPSRPPADKAVNTSFPALAHLAAALAPVFAWRHRKPLTQQPIPAFAVAARSPYHPRSRCNAIPAHPRPCRSLYPPSPPSISATAATLRIACDTAPQLPRKPRCASAMERFERPVSPPQQAQPAPSRPSRPRSDF